MDSGVFKSLTRDDKLKTAEEVAKPLGRSVESVQRELDALCNAGLVCCGAATPHPDPKQRALGSHGTPWLYWPSMRAIELLKKEGRIGDGN